MPKRRFWAVPITGNDPERPAARRRETGALAGMPVSEEACRGRSVSDCRLRVTDRTQSGTRCVKARLDLVGTTSEPFRTSRAAREVYLTREEADGPGSTGRVS
ncbi:Hypp4953 [Branchiostoma lanceolatum]|uniref:Hypp4953 protein n=1 Tax=Branchiostoma lanceolatum TaxID=7740 RepID=A0A8K0AC59_BRALA|nr:Hypp4953 [Branchiostoma lanceolatum]